MRRREALYLLAVGLIGSAFAVNVLLRTVWRDGSPDGIEAPSPGRPRDVDMERLREGLREGRLSDQEAAYVRER